MSYNASASSRAMYLGKDILGSVRTVTTDTSRLEDRYEYDAFGQPYQGDLSGGMNLGYTGKPYDTTTGLYNYGYRDYEPSAARFTTVDPIRDGNNWFAYVNHDPVNWVDPWGLSASDKKSKAEQFTSNVRDLVGTPYKYDGKTLDGLDCSGVVTYALNAMGYNVPATSAATMASGNTDWVTVTQGNTISQSTPGTLNFYDWNNNTIRHVNVGVGQQGNETVGQVVDATEGSGMTARNGNPNQVIPAGAGQVNQTYAPFSTNSTPVSQGTINFDVLEKNYKK
jgi:RHS repeat-associated protein